MARRPRYGSHRDANQKQDVANLRALGFKVFDFSQWLPWADLLIWDGTRITLWEWKTDRGRLTDIQKHFMKLHPGLVHEGRCVEDVLIEYGRLHGCTEGD